MIYRNLYLYIVYINTNINRETGREIYRVINVFTYKRNLT